MSKSTGLLFLIAVAALGFLFYRLQGNGHVEITNDAPEEPEELLGEPMGAWKPGAKHIKILVVLADPSDAAVARRGIARAKETIPNLDVDLKVPPTRSASAQHAILKGIAGKGYDGLIISPADPVHQAAMIDEAASKTLVFTQDRDVPNSKRACYVGDDPTDTGLQFAEEMKRALPAGGKIVVLADDPTLQETMLQVQSFKKTLQGSACLVSGVLYDNGDSSKAKDNLRKVLATEPKIAGIVALSPESTAAVVGMSKSATSLRAIKVLCEGVDEATLTALEKGAAYAVHGSYTAFVNTSVSNLFAFLNGNKGAIPDNRKWSIQNNSFTHKAAVATIRTYLKDLK